MGLVDFAREGHWVWLQENPSREAEEPGLTNWAPGEPNHLAAGQNCAAVQGYDGRWDDVGCEHAHSFRSPACEMPKR